MKGPSSLGTMGLGLLIAVIRAPSLWGQSATADALHQAHVLYEGLELERAIPLLKQIVSSSWTAEITPEQRVEAYTYLGAAQALAGRRDSAIVSFRAALELDPFTDLNPTIFTPSQLDAFAAARRATFAIAVRPVSRQRVDPRTDRVRFTAAATHMAALTVVVYRVQADSSDSSADSVVVFQGNAEGMRQFTWDGLLVDGHLAPPGRYELRVAGKSQVLDRSDSTRVYFDLRQETSGLQDTLPSLTDLLPTTQPGRAGTGELFGGLFVAGTAMGVAGGLSNPDLGSGLKTGATVVASTAAITGIVAFIRARRHRSIPENIAQNERRVAVRDSTNAAIRTRNQQRFGAAVLVITPAAGIGP